MPPKKPPWTVRASTREKRQASQAGGSPASKTPRSVPCNITRTIHQQVNDNSSMVAGAPNLKSPSASSAHPFRVQHAGSHTPTLGHGLSPLNQSPAQWWGPWGPPSPWVQYYQQCPPLPPPAVPGNSNNASNQQQSAHQQWQQNTVQANQPPVANYNSGSQGSLDKQQNQEDQPSPDPLVNALAVSTVPGKQPEPILSMHVSQSIKKYIWAGEYIDLAYLLETNPVPEDEKS